MDTTMKYKLFYIPNKTNEIYLSVDKDLVFKSLDLVNFPVKCCLKGLLKIIELMLILGDG